jgi:hypothetical protein
MGKIHVLGVKKFMWYLNDKKVPKIWKNNFKKNQEISIHLFLFFCYFFLNKIKKLIIKVRKI